MVDLTVADLLTLAGAVPVVLIIVEALKQAAALPDAVVQRFLPLFSMVVGIVVVELAVLAIGSGAWAQGALTGLLAGGAASGLYDAGKAIAAKPKP